MNSNKCRAYPKCTVEHGSDGPTIDRDGLCEVCAHEARREIEDEFCLSEAGTLLWGYDD